MLGRIVCEEDAEQTQAVYAMTGGGGVVSSFPRASVPSRSSSETGNLKTAFGAENLEYPGSESTTLWFKIHHPLVFSEPFSKISLLSNTLPRESHFWESQFRRHL